MPRSVSCLLLVILLMPGFALAQAMYRIDPVHSRVVFRVMHAGLSPSLGTVSAPSGYIRWDENDPTKSRVSVEIPIATLDLGNADWNRKTLTTFLDAKRFPSATFESTAVRAVSASLLEVDGVLKIAGGSVPITFTTVLNAHKRHPLTRRMTLGLQASTDFSRQALGIDAWQSLVGDSVHLDISVEATRETRAEKGEPP